MAKNALHSNLAAVIFNDAGEVAYVIGTGIDISERSAAEEALRAGLAELPRWGLRDGKLHREYMKAFTNASYVVKEGYAFNAEDGLEVLTFCLHLLSVEDLIGQAIHVAVIG